MSGTALMAPLVFFYFILTHSEVDKCSPHSNFTGEENKIQRLSC